VDHVRIKNKGERRKMQIAKNKTMATLIALFLLLTIAVTLVALPAANAHTPIWAIPTTAYIDVSPNPVGVGQTVFVVLWIDRTPSGALEANTIRPHNFQLTITKPDGSKEVKTYPYIPSPTSSMYTMYTPDQVGTYQFVFYYPGETYTWSGTYQNDTFNPSTSKTIDLIVQQEPIPAAIDSYPLPTEYWTRPIEGQNTYWYTVASNWLGTGSPPISGWSGRVQNDGVAPNSAHIMWTKPFREGGVVGGSNVGVAGDTFYNGMSYNQAFSNPIIMYGRLYYPESYGNSGSGGKYVCVDLRTGEELWRINTTSPVGAGVPSFGYYFDYEDGNQHGVLPEGLLFTSNFARAYEPRTGVLTNWNMTNVPSGTAVTGPKGEQLRYTLSNIGNATNPNWRLTQWNSSKVNQLTAGQIGVSNWFLNGFFNASLASRYDWNVSVPVLPGLSNPTITWAVLDDILIGKSSTFMGTSTAVTFGTPDPYTFWAISLKPASIGSLLWIRNYTAPAGNLSLIVGPVDEKNRVFLMYKKETMSWMGFSMDDGSLLWGPVSPSVSNYDYYEGWLYANCAYGNLYYCNYGGVLYCLDTKTGKTVWTYGNGGAGNSTYAGFQNTWGHYPMAIGAIADGKVYTHPSEHSPNAPLYKNALVRCINATDGTEIWTIMGWVGVAGSSSMAEADGYLVYLNSYDEQIYCIGKGPSATTVSIQNDAVTLGNSVMIKGTVIDIAAGTKQNEQAARFPHGVPAVSDASMGAWMEYVYMQKPYPTNATGVDVTLDAIDPNGNFIHIGTVTSDTSGMFKKFWTPDVPGEYTVIATFAGTESYWPSYAETAAGVSEAPTVTPPVEQIVQLPPFDLYILIATIAIIIAVAIVGILLLRKRA
jgi:outer membrane protein assembly factor BamB